MCWWSCLLRCAGSTRSAVDRCNRLQKKNNIQETKTAETEQVDVPRHDCE
jgi:hypothetical protein